MKLKKTEKLVVSKKMFASTKSLKNKDSDEKNSAKPKKKRKKNTNNNNNNNVSPKKTATPKKKKNTPSKTKHAEKDSLKSPAKTKMGKGTDKNLGSPSPSKTLAGVASGKNKDIDWSELGVQRCSGCNFTTNEEGIFAAHLSLCRLFNKQKIKTPSPSKKKQVSKSDISVSSTEKPVGHLGRLIGRPEKRAVIQEPYLEGSTPAQTVFLFRCYHCRSYFINIQTLKDHHRLAHGTKNLTVSLVPFTDDEAPEDINKKIIVDGSRIVPQVNWRRETVSVVPTNTTVTLQCSAGSPTGTKNTVYSHIRLQSAGSMISTPSTVVTPQTHPKTVPSETVTRDVTVMKNPLQEVRVQVTSSDKGTKSDEKAVKKGTEDIQRYPTGQSFPNSPILVPTSNSSSTTNQSTTNKMVVLNLIPKNQSVPCSPVQIEIPANSPLNTREYLKQIPNLAKVATQAIQTSQEGSKNWNNPTKNKAILPKSILLGVHPPPVMDLPLVLPQTSKLGSNPGVAVISTAQKIIQTPDGQFTNTSGVTSSVVSTKQKNRKIILFPLTSNVSSSGTLVAPGTALTATPIAAAITTSAVVTCATTMSPPMATPLPSSLAGPNLQTSVSPLLISSAPAVMASNLPSVWVLPSQTSLTSVDSKLTSSQVQNSISKQSGVLAKTIHFRSTAASTRITQSFSTSSSMTTQTVATVMACSPSPSSKTTNPNRQVVTITPVSEAAPTAAGMSLLEKITIVKSNNDRLKKTQERSDSTSLKPDTVVKVNSKCKITKTGTSTHSCTDDQTHSKSIQCVPSPNTKRKIAPDSDMPSSIISPSPKTKAHISSQTSISKSPNQNNLENTPSLSTSTSKGVDTSEDFTVALVAKKKVPVSTTCTSTIKTSLSMSGTANVSPLVIVRKSVGSNKLVVHTMVSANKLFQIQDAGVLKCSLCAAKVNIDLIRSHLYWHFHVENRNSAQCSKDNPCHYCSVIDYVISMIPQNKQPEKPDDTSSQTSLKPLPEEEQLESDVTISQDSCLPAECSGDSVDTEPLGLKISSTFSLQSEVNILSNEEQSQELPDLEPQKEKEKQTESQEERPQSSLDLPKTTLSKDKESCGIFTEEGNTAECPVLVIENTDETENIQVVDSTDGDDTSETSAGVSSKNFKAESPSQAEKNIIYKGNFYICGFNECTFSSLGMEEFKAHQENKHGKADGYSCVHCQMECLEPEVLVHHMETHLCGDMFILYRCAFPECNFGTNLMKSFTEHNIETHPRETVFLCYYCNANFQGCEALHKHLRANLLKYVHCPHCSVRNNLRNTILSHIKSDHPDKPRRIFVTGQMVCQLKQKVLNGSIFTDSESDSSDIDSDCMIVDDDILDRHLIKQTNVGVHDIFGKSIGKEAESGKTCVQARTISDSKNSSSDDDNSDCVIIDDGLYEQSNLNDLSVLEKTAEKEVDPRKTCKPSSNVSVKVNDKIQDDTDSNAKLTTNLTKPAFLKKNEDMISKQTGNIARTMVLNSSNFSKEKSSSENSTNLASTNKDKDGSESEEGCPYLQVKKVTHTYSRQKENRLSLEQQHLEDSKGASNQKFDKDKTPNSDGKSAQDPATLVKSCKRRILIRNNKPHGKVDVGTVGLDSIINPLYLFVSNEVHCRICTFKCVPLPKMHTHILLMHLHVFLYQCSYCHKKCSCKVEMTEHCEYHGHNNQGFMVLPEPDWDQVIRSCLPATCKASNLKSAVTETTAAQTLPFSNKAKLTKTEHSLSSKTISLGCKRKSLEVLDSVGCKVAATKENSSKHSSSNVRTSSNEDRNIFSLFSFGLESETETQYNEEESRNLDSCNSLKQNKFDSSFSSKLFTLPGLPSFDKTPVKDLPVQELSPQTPTPEGDDQITVAKEQYMRELHLIAISKVSNCKHQKNLAPVCLSSRLSKYPNTAMARLRSWRTALEKTPFSLVSKSSRAKKSKKSLPRHSMLITPKTVRKKVLSKTSKLKIGRVRRSRSSSKGHLLRSASKVRHSPRTWKGLTETRKSLLKTPEKYVARKRPQSLKGLTETRKSLLKTPEKYVARKRPQSLKGLTETRKSLLKTPEKYVARKRPQSLKSPSSSLRTKPTQSASPKPKVSKRLAVKRKRVKSTSRKLVKASLRAMVQKKNLTISHGQRSVKKALNQASRKSSVQMQDRIRNKKRMICKGQQLLKKSSSLKIDAKKHMSVPTGSNKCLFFSCSWCQFRVSDRKHFQRHISLHNFFPQGCKMHCPYCSYTTPSALVLEKHIPMHMDKHPFGCRHCGFSAKTKMMVVRHCKRSHPDIPIKLVNRSTSSQKLKPSWPVVSFSPKVRLKKCARLNSEDKPKRSKTKN